MPYKMASRVLKKAIYSRPFLTRMAYTSTVAATLKSYQHFCLPEIPELHKKDFLDILIPENHARTVEEASHVRKNPMMEALKTTAHQTFTEKGAPAYSSTHSPTLDAFAGISRYTTMDEMAAHLGKAWMEDSDLTIRIIWNLRSIHDGKGEKEAFYRAFGWLYEHYPRTAISNLHFLAEPVCVPRRKNGNACAHGYWKDLLNILALATVDQLGDLKSTFLHHPRTPSTHSYHKRRHGEASASRVSDEAAKKEAAAKRNAKQKEDFDHLIQKLSQPKYRALYIAVARLFADQLVKDIQVVDELEKLGPDGNRISLLKQISLAGKWAPTPAASHDRVTNIATAISELIYASQALGSYPSILKQPLPERERAAVLRSYYQRWILTELRRVSECVEPLMSANRWTEIKYNRVPSICMQTKNELFIKHDPVGFEEYLISVESKKKTITGATLLPHELVAKAMELASTARATNSKGGMNKLRELKKDTALLQLRVVEAQWNTLISNLRQSRAIKKSLAVCDVSGSMGHLGAKYDKKHVHPIEAAVSLSLVLATLAEPPFSGGFITFSESPSFQQVDLTKPLIDQIDHLQNSHWGFTTNLYSVFIDLLLPLAVKNKIKQEDMIERLFIFSDMQFDASNPTKGSNAANWTTNYDAIERAYTEAGYKVPQIVYWDLARGEVAKTVEVESDRKGVAMMNGFSPAILKVFMGEEEIEGWQEVSEDGECVKPVEKEVFDPVTVMKKALMRPSFDGLVIVD